MIAEVMATRIAITRTIVRSNINCLGGNPPDLTNTVQTRSLKEANNLFAIIAVDHIIPPTRNVRSTDNPDHLQRCMPREKDQSNRLITSRKVKTDERRARRIWDRKPTPTLTSRQRKGSQRHAAILRENPPQNMGRPNLRRIPSVPSTVQKENCTTWNQIWTHTPTGHRTRSNCTPSENYHRTTTPRAAPQRYQRHALMDPVVRKLRLSKKDLAS